MNKSWITRSLSGIIYIGVIIGCIFWGTIPFSILISILGVLAIVEFEKICEGISESSVPSLIMDCTGVIFLSFSWLIYPLLGWIVVILCRLILQLYMKNERPVRSLAVSLMSQIYVGLPLACMALMGKYVGLHFILAIFLFIWINDTGAFVVGSLLGKHRLFERISPKKSWEGFFGGMGFTLLAGWLFAIGSHGFWDIEMNVISWLILAFAVSLFSTWGDLVESLMKRSLNLKDSGHIMPGHGGILDRLDSLLLVMPAVFIFLIIYFTLTPPSVLALL